MTTTHFDLGPDTSLQALQRYAAEHGTTTYIEMGTDAVVEVVAWNWNTAHLLDGTTAERRNLYRPMWLVRAEQREADARDERETLEDVRYGGCQ